MPFDYLATSIIYAALIPRISAHALLMAQCKVHRPWALFRKGTKPRPTTSRLLDNNYHGRVVCIQIWSLGVLVVTHRIGAGDVSYSYI